MEEDWPLDLFDNIEREILDDKFVLSNISYTHWIINAIMVFVVACIVTIGINYIFYRNEFKELDIIMKRLII